MVNGIGESVEVYVYTGIPWFWRSVLSDFGAQPANRSELNNIKPVAKYFLILIFYHFNKNVTRKTFNMKKPLCNCN